MSGGQRHGDAMPSVRASRLTTWHQELFTAVGRWRWLRALDDGVSGVTQP